MAFTERSEGTRKAILAAARTLFTERGYEGTTIRAVASVVGVDPSMVMRYYGSKVGLFSAAVDLDLRLNEIPPVPHNQVGEALLRHVLSRWETDPAADPIMIMLRSASTHPVAAEHARTLLEGQIAAFITRTIGWDSAEATSRAGLISAQLLGLALTRYIVELPSVVKMDMESLVTAVAPVVRHYLTGELGDAPTAVTGAWP